jgi:hypothetical protein
MRWEEHIARVGREKVRTRFLWGNMRGSGHNEELGVDIRIILNR